uniref:Defensin-like cystein-rich peptide n=1 Tax=Torenia fournieri TaxID=68875 RepID=B9ZZZ1_9LAMI|nr:defensin-like cystein-rich peptide [Torenia fournieri]
MLKFSSFIFYTLLITGLMSDVLASGVVGDCPKGKLEAPCYLDGPDGDRQCEGLCKYFYGPKAVGRCDHLTYRPGVPICTCYLCKK